jgi:hypothetical protein
MSGRLDLLGTIKSLQENIHQVTIEDIIDNYAAETSTIKNFKHIFLSMLATIYQKLSNFEDEQELAGNLTDMAIHIFTAESALLRLKKLAQKNHTDLSLTEDIVRLFLYKASDKIFQAAKEVINSYCNGKEHGQLTTQLRQLNQTQIFNTKEARRRIADKMVKQGKYCF